jgi:polyhydroxyalkanoate synthesis regulator phasin
MFGIKTRKLERRIEDLDRLHQHMMNALQQQIDTNESRIRALEEATKPKSGKVK